LNERVHATDWKTKDMDIQLSLRAASMNDLYYLLLYESRALAVAFRKSQSGREKDAL